MSSSGGGGGSHHHRSSLRQSNKAYKSFSKGALKRANRGRVEDAVRVSIKPQTKEGQKQRRLDQARDTQQRKRQETVDRKRLGSRNGAPKIVGVVALSPTLEVGKLAQLIRSECTPCNELPSSFPFIQTMRTVVERKDARFTFVLTPRDPIAVADVAKMADVLLLVMNPTDADGDELGVDNLGNHFIQLIKAQGLPSVIGVTTGVSALASAKKKASVARTAQRYFHTVFNESCRVVNVDTAAETQALLRWVHNTVPATVLWRQERARLLGEHVAYVPNEGSELAAAAAAEDPGLSSLFEAGKGQLRVTGFLRGSRTLSANQLVHITGFGDFPVVQIEGVDGDAPAWGKHGPSNGAAGGADAATVLSRADADRETFQDLLGEGAAALANDGGGDDITAEELAAAVAQNPDLAATSSMFAVGGDGAIAVQRLGPERPLFSDWRSQDTPLVQSFSSVAPEHLAVQAAAPQWTADTIASVRREDPAAAEAGASLTIKNVWDDIKLSGSDDDDEDGAGKQQQKRHMGSDDEEEEQNQQQGAAGDFGGISADLARGLGRFRSPGKFTAPGARNGMGDDDDEEAIDARGVDVSDIDEDEDGEDGAAAGGMGAYDERRALRRAARKEDMADQGQDYDDTASQLSAFSQFSMGSLRAEGMSGAEVAAKFSQLPWAEKVRRLCKYGRKGEDKLARLKARLEREARDFPDEVEWDRRVTARARFALYRPLKAFRQSAWNYNTALPAEYGRIINFANFTIAERNAKDACSVENLSASAQFDEAGNYMGESDDDVDADATDAGPLVEDPAGRAVAPERAQQVTVVIANVPAEAARMVQAGQALALVWGLFRHEHKASVLHLHIKRHPEFEQPIRNKDPMHLQVGFRRFLTAPIFSVQVKGTQKLLMQRFLPQATNAVATVYGRVMFPPATVLMFPAHVLGTYRDEYEFNPLAASGTLLTCDPDRIVLKRAVLSGFPVKASYNSCVVKHMFSTPTDVQWFKTVELWTKQGLYGRVRESRGLHGLFKASFNNVIKHKKPVYMTLYKRQFPVWNPNNLG
jgi:pre-rRNA-processing protein TSR1